MHYIGLDSGSTTTKGILLHHDKIIDQKLLATAGDPKRVMEEIIAYLTKNNAIQPENIKIISTGYGRKLISADLSITEITCHGKGARYLSDIATHVIDVGGQDCKTILLGEAGTVKDFNMNDKCAAGTGRFVEVMMRSLGEDINGIDAFVEGATPIAINSMCTVFAESEIVSLVAKGKDKADIALGVLHSIAKRINNQFSKLGKGSLPKILLTGGLSKSSAFTEVLAQYVRAPVFTHAYSQYAGAIGAAVIGAVKLKDKSKTRWLS